VGEVLLDSPAPATTIHCINNFWSQGLFVSQAVPIDGSVKVSNEYLRALNPLFASVPNSSFSTNNDKNILFSVFLAVSISLRQSHQTHCHSFAASSAYDHSIFLNPLSLRLHHPQAFFIKEQSLSTVFYTALTNQILLFTGAQQLQLKILPLKTFPTRTFPLKKLLLKALPFKTHPLKHLRLQHLLFKNLLHLRSQFSIHTPNQLS
jgi:hypothetical protein